MFKKLTKFYKSRNGTALILFGLLSPILLTGLAYMNNFAIWNELYQSTKGASKVAAHSLGQQFFSRCVAQTHPIGDCTNTTVAGNVATATMTQMIQTYMDNNYNGLGYNVNVGVQGSITGGTDFLQIPVRVTVDGFDDQLIAAALTGFTTEVTYDIQTVINLHFTEVP